MSSASRHRRGFVAVGAALLMLTLALPASARCTPASAIRHRRVQLRHGWIVVNVTVEFGGIFQIRRHRDDASAFFAHDNYWYRETHVRESDGETIVVSGNGNFIESQAVRMDGSIFTFTSVNAGQLFTVRDSDGHVVLRDRARLETILFDTTGDDQPGGEFLDIPDTTFHGGFLSLDADFARSGSTDPGVVVLRHRPGQAGLGGTAQVRQDGQLRDVILGGRLQTEPVEDHPDVALDRLLGQPEPAGRSPRSTGPQPSARGRPVPAA